MHPTMFSPDGIEVPVSSATQAVNLRSRGYTDQPPTSLPVPNAAGETFDPAVHTVPEVLAYIEAHPEQGDAVVAAEQAGQARKGIVGDQPDS